jgi:glucose/arabinose dehydrogenase
VLLGDGEQRHWKCQPRNGDREQLWPRASRDFALPGRGNKGQREEAKQHAAKRDGRWSESLERLRNLQKRSAPNEPGHGEENPVFASESLPVGSFSREHPLGPWHLNPYDFLWATWDLGGVRCHEAVESAISVCLSSEDFRQPLKYPQPCGFLFAYPCAAPSLVYVPGVHNRWVVRVLCSFVGLAGFGAAIAMPAVSAVSAVTRVLAQTVVLPTTGTTTPLGPPTKLVPLATAVEPIGVVTRRGVPGDESLYVMEKGGKVRALEPNGVWRTAVVLDLSARVSTNNERGLIGLAFPPYSDSVLFATYTEKNGTIVVSEFGFDGKVADPASERVLLRVPHPNEDHNGGTLVFTRDGLLLIGLGDGGGVGTKGGAGDVKNNAQNLNVLYGKILRIDPRGATADRPYGIPSTNPYARGVTGSLGATTKARPEIWAYGLRNPWRLSLDENDQLWITDVGQASWEEINQVPVDRAGVNFGWKAREGKHAYKGAAKPRGATDPIWEFPHADGRCAIIGGAAPSTGPWSPVVTAPGAQSPDVANHFYFGELCSGKVYQLAQSSKGAVTVRDLGVKLSYITSISAGLRDELILTSLNGGIFRVEHAA